MNKQQLANHIWASANNMRNKIDANEYKDYILGLIFYKFLSDTEVKYFTETCGWEEDELPELVENYEDKNMEKKNRGNEGVLIIDASKGFVKDGKQNKLRACDVKKIADTYRERKDIPGFSRVVSRDEIRRNEYNLNIPRYVDSSEAPVKYDIYSTMFGGIPNSEIPPLRLTTSLMLLMPTKMLKEDKAEYIQALIDTREQEDIELFIDCMSALHCRHIQHDIANYNESVGDNIGDKTNEIAQIGDKKAAILAFIADNPGIKASIIADHIGLKASRTRDYLTQLVKEGKILAEGANKNRTYKIAKEDK